MIGAGPGGYVAGIRLGQLKKKALVVEKDKPGGICLNVGCIPSKALINASKIYDKLRHGADIGILADNLRVDMAKMQSWKGEVVSKLTGGVQARCSRPTAATTAPARPRFVGPQHRRAGQAPTARQDDASRPAHIVIATGSRPIEIPGFKFDGKRIVDSTGALAFATVPERFVVIGGGYIGIEIGTLYAKLGAQGDRGRGAADASLPATIPRSCSVVARKLKKLGVEVLTGAKAKSLGREGRPRAPSPSRRRRRGQTIDADKVLVAVGRRPNSESLGLEAVGVKIERGFVPVDKQQRTNVPGIYAIGDVAGQPMLAHKASQEAEVVAEVIAGHKRRDGRALHPGRHLQRPRRSPPPGSRADEADEAGPQGQGRQVPVRGAGPRHRQRRHRRLREGRHRRRAATRCWASTWSATAPRDVIAEAALAIEMGALADDLASPSTPTRRCPRRSWRPPRRSLGEAIHIQNR